MVKVYIKGDDEYLIPQKGEDQAVAWDLKASEDFEILPSSVLIHDTKVIIDFSEDNGHSPMALLVAPRSSLFFKKSVMLGNSIGIIDSTYKGPNDTLKLILYNVSSVKSAKFVRGERIAQFFFAKTFQAKLEVDNYDINFEESRGGLGSTGGIT